MSSKPDPKSAVLSYLTAQNRPYSTNDVVSNLHNEHGKTAVQKALDLLVAEGKLKEKINGKQKAYVVDQAKQPAASDHELKDMDAKVKEAEEAAAKSKLEADKAEGYVKGMESLPVTEQVLRQIKQLEEEVGTMQQRVDALKGGKNNLVSKEEVRKLEKARNDAVQVIFFSTYTYTLFTTRASRSMSLKVVVAVIVVLLLLVTH